MTWFAKKYFTDFDYQIVEILENHQFEKADLGSTTLFGLGSNKRALRIWAWMAIRTARIMGEVTVLPMVRAYPRSRSATRNTKPGPWEKNSARITQGHWPKTMRRRACVRQICYRKIENDHIPNDISWDYHTEIVYLYFKQ